MVGPKFWNLWRKGLDRSKILKSLTQGFGQVQSFEIFDARVWTSPKFWNLWRKGSGKSKNLKFHKIQEPAIQNEVILN